MIAQLQINGTARAVDLSAATCLAIPIRTDGRHPRFFVDESARFQPLQSGGFCGRVAGGGSCNVDRVEFVPHCHGTHTEGVGHILGDARPVQSDLDRALLPAAVVSVTPVDKTPETAAGVGPVITAESLSLPAGVRALVIRTLPNDESKCTRDYAQQPPYPLLSAEAMARIVESGIEHLLIDTPSVDAADDGGLLLQHRRFWGFQDGHPDPARAGCTITEMIYVPDSCRDGTYLLALGVSAIEGDASPSAPLLFPVS